MAPGKTKLTLHKGPRSSLEEADMVVQWVRKLRHNGMPVSMNMAILKASQLNGQFRCKSSTAKYAVICCIMRSNKIVIRSKTNESQMAPSKKQDEAEQFVIRMVPKVQGPHHHPDWVGNMDQTAVFFSMTPSTTLQEQGSRTVNVRTSSSSTMHLTLCVFITASGKIERPFIIFKAKPSGHIA